MSAAAAASAGPLAANSKALHQAMKGMAPALQKKGHKGQHGRVGVMGGSKAYTGAPFFAAMTALRMGVDLATVFCSVEAGIAIKSYSPDLMVRPCLFPAHMEDTARKEMQKQGEADKKSDVVSLLSSDVIEWSSKLDVMVVGPGLGKDELMVRTVAHWIQSHADAAAKDKGKDDKSKKDLAPVVLDGDGIHVLLENESLLRAANGELASKHLVLTPNAAEFRRLWEKFIGKDSVPPFEVDVEGSEWIKQNKTGGEISVDDPLAKDTAKLAKALGGATLVRKGQIDIVSNGERAVVITAEGSPRRVGGQGDMLAGATGTFIAWARLARAQKEHEEEKDGKKKQGDKDKEELVPELMLSAWTASHFCRALQQKAFARHGRSMLASNLLDVLPETLQQWYPIDGVDITPAKL